MPLTAKEIQENSERVEFDHHFDLRLKKRNIRLGEVKDYLKNKIPIIKDKGENKYKISYQTKKGKYLTMYVLRTSG